MLYVIFSEGDHPLLDISSIGYSDDPKITRFGPGKRNQYIIHYVLRGKGCFNGTPLKSGQGFLITPGLLEHYFPDSRDPWEFLWIISEDPKMSKLFSFYSANPDTNIFSFDDINVLKKSVESVKNSEAYLSSSAVLDIFLNIFNQHLHTYTVGKHYSNADIYIDAAVKYINANIHSKIKIEDITELLGITQPYLFRIFKEKFKESPKQYINRNRLERAKVLLEKNDMTVTQIAYSVGFDDVLAFSKFFSMHMGISPTGYREQQKNKF